MSALASTNRSTARRVGAIAAIVALLVVAGVFARRDTKPAAASAVRTSGMPTLPPAGALDSSWYCPGAGAAGSGQSEGFVSVMNPGDAPVQATVTVIPSTGASGVKQLPVAPRATAVLRLSDVVRAPAAAALVELQGGAAAVEQVVAGPNGLDGNPCATAGSDHWYFAAGTTEKDATSTLMLFNPFPGDAIVDLSFATDQGPTAPGEFQGLVVPARGLVAVDVGQHVRRRASIATSVVVRSGRVIAGRIQLQTSPPGLTSTLGAPAVANQWIFPDGVASDGLREVYRIYNPSNRESQVDVSFSLDQGEAEPFQLTVPPASAIDLVTNDQTRIPKNVAHAATVTVTNGVGVVAERTATATRPSSRLGTSTVFGARRTAKQWLFPWGSSAATYDEWIVVFNPGSQPASVSAVAIGGGQQVPVEGLQGLTVPPGRRLALRLGDHIVRPDLPLLIDANAPVVVERGLFVVSGNGMSASLGIPSLAS